ncbi:hypothetical protein ACFLZG_06115 [Thermodesulfobacteriota bacterium]
MQTNIPYEVVSPLGKSISKVILPVHPIPTLEGKKIAFFWTVFTNGDVLADALIDLLHKRFNEIETVKLPAGKEVKWGDYPTESIEDVIKEAGVDAAIVLVGG